eukprot:5361801-Pyramimonas_sp.AAC.1
MLCMPALHLVCSLGENEKTDSTCRKCQHEVGYSTCPDRKNAPAELRSRREARRDLPRGMNRCLL